MSSNNKVLPLSYLPGTSGANNYTSKILKV